jgi:hypothetical protein
MCQKAADSFFSSMSTSPPGAIVIPTFIYICISQENIQHTLCKLNILIRVATYIFPYYLTEMYVHTYECV